MRRTVSMTVNGRAVSRAVEPRTHLADFLREELLLTGTHLGCEHGVCGACTVLLDGAPARSCIAFAVACDGAQVRTVENFEDDPVMGALRAAFSQHHALQCGYCTPGMLITARDIVTRLPGADAARVREELAGNLCRCTGYLGVVEAIGSVLAGRPVDATAPVAVDAPRELSASLPAARPAGAGPAAGARGRVEAGRYRLPVPVGADALWSVLEDLEQVARCLPGAAITGDPHARPVAFSLGIALGPMRVAFVGEADVTHDARSRSGEASGRGQDARSRSVGEGRLRFAVVDGEGDASSCELSVSLDYTLTGPLAHFSRGPVVDAAVEQLLEQFAANAARMAAGEEVAPQVAVGGIALALRAVWRSVRAWLGGTPR